MARVGVLIAIVSLLLESCAVSGVQVKSGEMPEDQAITYMILSDQLNRVRNIWPSDPPKACLVTSMPGPAYMAGVGPVDPAILARLQQDNEKAAEKLEIDSSPACMANFFGADGKLLKDVEGGNVMLAAGEGLGFAFGSNCREHEGAIYQPPYHDHIVTYDLRNENGMLSLIGGDPCVTRYRI